MPIAAGAQTDRADGAVGLGRLADARALGSATRLGLADDVAALRRNTTDATELTRLVAALVRCDLAGDHRDVMAAAGD
jgi:hypothetical protein